MPAKIKRHRAFTSSRDEELFGIVLRHAPGLERFVVRMDLFASVVNHGPAHRSCLATRQPLSQLARQRPLLAVPDEVNEPVLDDTSAHVLEESLC
jgi:hypothetical protein